MKGSLAVLVLLLIVGVMMVPALGMTVTEQADAEGEVDETTSDLEAIYAPLMVGWGPLVVVVAIGALFAWLGSWAEGM